ncbi:AtuA-related protein [Salipiger mucosus]|uniref:Small uncharacterized protein n=1 Tax=Salipiger mucosus DSM 16094 TaxID=1123237 RepID=S9Q2R1_9RHOB|nr:hypothetical protein [Salipiger mucosus]EPX75566.1 Small uncharacterized protein [Salipiger mucosus DSM 16094]
MILRDIAHCRSGDKGDIANIAVIARDPADYARLCREVTEARVAAFLGERVKGSVTRYELPRLGALNFVLTEALSGGVVSSLALDAHGKSLSSALLALPLEGA